MKNYMRQKASFILSEREKDIYMDEQEELKRNGFQSSLFLKGFFLVNKKEKKNCVDYAQKKCNLRLCQSTLLLKSISKLNILLSLKKYEREN